jgi:hypothetical protein
LLNGKEVAVTNDAGVALFSHRGIPGTEYIVQLDTSAERRLVPENPTRVFVMGDQHRVFVVDQVFEDTSERHRRRRRRRITKIE